MNWRPATERASGVDCRRLAGGLGLAAALSTLASVAPAGDEIAEVQTLAELRRVRPITLPGGGEVQLGLAPSGTDGGPWELLYCLEKRSSAASASERDDANQEQREPLGPVSFTVEPPRELAAAAHARPDALQGQPARLADDQGQLYCGRVVAAVAGTYVLRVYAANGRLVAQKKLDVRSPRSCYWLELASEAETEHMTREPLPAVPVFTGEDAVARVADQRFDLASVVPENLLRETNLLPGGIPATWVAGAGLSARPGEPKYPLLLSREGDELVIQSMAVDLENGEIEQPFLARWWLNGQAVLPARNPKEMEPATQLSQAQAERALSEGHLSEKRLQFVLPRLFDSLRNGDRIRLQVLYCPNGYDLLAEAILNNGEGMERHSMMWDSSGGSALLLSNPLELVVTDANSQSPKVKTRPESVPLKPREPQTPDNE